MRERTGERPGSGGGFVRRIWLDERDNTGGYPFTLPVVQALSRRDALPLAPGVTFLVGENGSGKSTLVEAIAVAAGFNAEGGSQNFRFATRSSESSLGAYLRLAWGVRKPRGGFFLRAESYYNVATEIERLDEDRRFTAYGGVSPHERSHGQSFLDLAVHRFSRNGFYLLDEPEAALSVQGCMAMMVRLADLVAQGCQFVVATHSPILLALPGSVIYEIAETGEIQQLDYDQALHVRLTRDFLASPERYLKHLFAADEA
ncbi:AAA family ATPase [Segniliparus rugosus]|uniref:AAA+ ATPase domain-containing protein n=1 Tax=Segniliparus rugosus (strain ATCC BAA-974 / DSM 45345 / CCUG 50838 / CIP 108380 / JCM 13579 / CDC 945) TaxID=679197 RepID=E5XTM5_SEGRC|nr:AAA family ATPase [Segniliparus rugosus]EFV12287.1 hypothetical protein HMPREF9336_02847 [Segniliparus rugosus ATCC BAA-974]